MGRLPEGRGGRRIGHEDIRAHFLGALSVRRRAAFVAQARHDLEAVLAELQHGQVGDAFDRASLRAASRVTRARRAWLDEAERALRGERSG